MFCAVRRPLELLVAVASLWHGALAEAEVEDKEKLLEDNTPTWIYVAELLVVIVLSLLFEQALDSLKDAISELGALGKTLLRMIECLTQEIMTLGFIGLVVFVGTKTDVALIVAKHTYPAKVASTFSEEDDPLAESFESIHMFIFCVMLSFIAQCTVLMILAYYEAKKWQSWEHARVRMPRTVFKASNNGRHNSIFGSLRGDSRRLTGADMPKGSNFAAMNIEALLRKDGYIDANGQMIKPVEFDSINPLLDLIQNNSLRSLIRWRAVRHEFMFPSKIAKGIGALERDVYTPPEPHYFNFWEYLSMKQGETLVEMMEVSTSTWIAGCLLCFVIPVLALIDDYWFILLLALGTWAILFSILAFGVHINSIYNQIMPNIPTHPEMILKAFEGTSTAALQHHHREKLLEVEHQHIEEGREQDTDLPIPNDDSEQGLRKPLLHRDRTFEIFSQRFGGAQIEKKATSNLSSYSRPRYVKFLNRIGLIKLTKNVPSTQDTLFYFHEAGPSLYKSLLQLLTFFEAIIVALLIVAYFGNLAGDKWDLFQHCCYSSAVISVIVLAYHVIPRIVGRLTVVTCIEHMKDRQCIEEVIFESKKTQVIESVRLLELASAEEKINELVTLKKGSMESAAHHMDARTEANILRTFNMFDQDSSGTISKTELYNILESFCRSDNNGLPKSNAREQLWQVVDEDDSGEIDFEEFKALMAMVLHKETEEEKKADLDKLFKRFDKDDSGYLTIAELTLSLDELGVSIDENGMALLIFQVFQKVKQRLDLNEFFILIDGLERMSDEK